MSLLSVAEARRRLMAAVQPVEADETVPLEAAYGRVLAAPVTAPFPLPPFANAEMDGFALRAGDVRGASEAQPVVLRVIGDVPAGHPFEGVVGEREAVRITTGAPLPAGADAVVPVEDTDAYRRQAAALPLPETVAVRRAVAAGTYVRPRGKDTPAGHVLLPAGRRLNAREVALLAMVGMKMVTVRRKPRVAFFAAGDELLPAGAPLTPGKIYETNTYTLRGLLASCPVEGLPLGVTPDSAAAVRAMLEEAVAAGADFILSSAGASVGPTDFVHRVLAEQGEVHFWKVNVRPGKPVAFGAYRGVPMLSLPGNPASSFVSFEVFVRPLLHRLAGGRGWKRLALQARLAEAVTSDGRESYLRGLLAMEDGRLTARLVGTHQGSGNLLGLAQAEALIVVPAGVHHLPAGAEVTVWPLQLHP